MVSGLITGSDGKPIAGARVVARAVSSGVERSTVSTAAGEYLLLDLADGLWKIRVEADGYPGVRPLDLWVVPALRQTLDLHMSRRGERLTGRGGEISALNQFQSGVVDFGFAGQRTMRFSTRVAGSSETVLDDLDVSPLISRGQFALTRYVLVPRSYQEMRLTAALFTADSNVTPGGQRAIVSRRGEDRFHWQVFGIPENNLLAANAGFSSSNLKLESNQYGGSVSGPFRKNRSHFYVVYDGLRQDSGEVLTGYVPTPDFAANVAALNPALAPLVHAYPAGSAAISGSPYAMTFLGTGDQITNEDALGVRLDDDLASRASGVERDALFFRGSLDAALTKAPIAQAGTYLEDTLERRAHPLSGVLGWTHHFSPMLTDDARLGYVRGSFESAYNGALNLPFSLVVTGLTTLNGNQSTYGASNVYSVQDNLAWVHGKHTLETGGELRRQELNQRNSAAGTLDFISFGAFASDDLSTASYSQALSGNGLREVQFYGWAQENWRPRGNLGLGAGVRYQFFNRPHEINGKAIPFDFATCGAQGFCGPGASFDQLNRWNFDPRISAAWAPERGPDWLRSRVVVRAGGGIYHTNGLLADQSQPIYNEVENFSLSSATQPGLSYPLTPFLAEAAGVASALGMDRRRKDAYVTEWSVSLQGTLPERLVTTATYFGAQGTHLPADTYVNLIDPQTRSRPYPAFGQVSYWGNTGSSSYNAFAFLVQRDMWRGMQATAGYSLGHEIDDGASGAGEADAPEDPSCPRCGRASGDGDVRQTLGLTDIYQVPFGSDRPYHLSNVWLNRAVKDWELVNDLTARTGLPVNVTIDRSSTQVATGYTVNQRPDRVPGVSLRPANGQSMQEWLNPAAFTTVQGLYGDAGRNVARGPGAWQLNTGLRRTFLLPRKIRLRVTGEMLNTFNHTQLGQPLSDWSTKQFGEIVTSSNTSRVGVGGARALFVSFDVTH